MIEKTLDKERTKAETGVGQNYIWGPGQDGWGYKEITWEGLRSHRIAESSWGEEMAQWSLTQ